MLNKTYHVYIMTNQRNTTLYTGVTSDLRRRAYEHRNGLCEGFTKRYNLNKLVWFDACEDVAAAIAREKQIKGGSRRKKIELIDVMNPGWEDLYERLG